jgi:hypothetical protein
MAKKILEFIVVGISLVTFCVFAVVFAFDWAGGCGEVFTYADGSLHQGECIGREWLNELLQGVFK